MRYFQIFCLLVVVGISQIGIGSHVVGQDRWGHLKGRIVVIGEKPELKKEVVDKDQPTCLSGKEAPVDDNLLVDEDGGLKDAFVMMYLKGEKPTVHPSYEKMKSKPVVLDNKNCRFAPHALFVRTGQPLHLRNSDDVGHNCHITLFNNELNVNVPINDHVEVKLTEVEKVPGPVVCDIHRWMDAVLLVRDEPYVAISDEKGNFEMQNIPVGEWKFQFWHRKTGYMRDLEVPGMKVGRRGEIKVEIEDAKTLDLGELKIEGKEFKK
ncbi:MAG: hypothetical protein AAGA30_05755 [Planctomycetota bacterium]